MARTNDADYGFLVVYAWVRQFESLSRGFDLAKDGWYLGYSPPPLLERLIEDAQKSTSND
ncbi:hypothetical protein GCM10009000_125450 [Halobacterium noricense]